LHEFRHPDDPHAIRLAALGWHFPYYGAVDTTPQWVNLLAAYCARYGPAVLDEPVTDRAWRAVTVRDSLLSALTWIVGRMDAWQGYVWVRRSAPNGIVNQVWEDSHDSYYDTSGTLLDPSQPYAPVAVQGYTYDALLNAAWLLTLPPAPSCEAAPAASLSDARGARFEASAELPFDPAWLLDRASALRERVLRDFWLPDLDTFAQAWTSDGPTRVVASSAGHLLNSRVLDHAPEIAERLAQRLFEPDLLAGAGMRTKSTGAARFRAGAYHNGSSWPMDTGVIADGLRRWGFLLAAAELERRILNGCAFAGGLPEFLRGDADGSLSVNTTIVDTIQDGVENRLEQPPQANQGWTATRVWRILHIASATP
jgi:glycogen debranching enzyme